MRERLRCERGAASIVALFMLVIMTVMGTGLLYVAKKNADDTRHYSLETRLLFCAESGLLRATRDIERGNLAAGQTFVVGEEELLRDETTDGMRNRIYIKGQSGGIIVFSFAETTDSPTNMKLFKQARCLMEKKDEGYVFSARLP